MSDRMSMEHSYGLVRQEPDIRDFKLSLVAPPTLPPKVSLRSRMSPVWDQGPVGSCTAFASTAAAIYTLHTQGVRRFTPGWMADYYWARLIEGNQNEDSGATIRGAVKALARFGVPHIRTWPYTPFALALMPSSECVASAAKHKVIRYEAVDQTSYAVRACLASGRPVIVGIAVHESFEDAGDTGIVPMPRGELLGWHCVLVVGYDGDRAICRNSWGRGWGNGGYFTIPLAYLSNQQIAGDFWTIEGIT